MYLLFSYLGTLIFWDCKVHFLFLHHHWKSQQSRHCWETWLFSFILQSTVPTQLAKPLTSNKEKWHLLILHELYRSTNIILLFRHTHITKQKKPSVDWLVKSYGTTKEPLVKYIHVLNLGIFSQNTQDDWLRFINLILILIILQAVLRVPASCFKGVKVATVTQLHIVSGKLRFLYWYIVTVWNVISSNNWHYHLV